MNKLISVIMSIYKEPVEEVKNSIDSILSQTYENWEMVIVLDCPDNISVKNYLMAVSQDNDNFFVIENQVNLGLGASLNKAVAASNGDFCARMDVEDQSFPNRFEKQMDYIQRTQDVDLLFTQWQETHSDGSIKTRKPSSADVRHIAKNFFIKVLLLHPTLIIRSEILKNHPYPEMARPEDWVLFLDLIRLGYNFDLLEDVLYTYVVDDSQKYWKVRGYSENLLPHLLKNIYHYFTNVYFWFYCFRILGEFIISRNEYVYWKTSKLTASAWKLFFKSV